MDNYSGLQEIGRGAQGVVYTARHVPSGDVCVLKAMHVGSADDCQKAVREAEHVQLLAHTAVVAYRECFVHEELLYLVMEYCEGGDMRRLLDTSLETPYSQDQVLLWFVQIALALQHVHERGVLHRDLKSENIFITRAGYLKLGDFGISKLLQSKDMLAATYIGTPYYMSPELFKGEPYDAKADVWALGCILYELCTRKRAFQADNINNLIMRVLRAEHGPLPTGYSPPVVELIKDMLQLNPTKRPLVSEVLSKPILRRFIATYAVTALGIEPDGAQFKTPAHSALRAQLGAAGLGPALARSSQKKESVDSAADGHKQVHELLKKEQELLRSELEHRKLHEEKHERPCHGGARAKRLHGVRTDAHSEGDGSGGGGSDGSGNDTSGGSGGSGHLGSDVRVRGAGHQLSQSFRSPRNYGLSAEVAAAPPRRPASREAREAQHGRRAHPLIACNDRLPADAFGGIAAASWSRSHKKALRDERGEPAFSSTLVSASMSLSPKLSYVEASSAMPASQLLPPRLEGRGSREGALGASQPLYSQYGQHSQSSPTSPLGARPLIIAHVEQPSHLGDERSGHATGEDGDDPDSSGMSAKERVLARREQLRKQEEQAKSAELLRARQQYFSQRQNAERKQRQQYIGSLGLNAAALRQDESDDSMRDSGNNSGEDGTGSACQTFFCDRNVVEQSKDASAVNWKT